VDLFKLQTKQQEAATVFLRVMINLPLRKDKKYKQTTLP
jgi:hypothetical protein